MQYQTTLPIWVFYNPERKPQRNVVQWSGKNPPPAVGTVVYPTKKGWDGQHKGTVIGYIPAMGWLGLVIQMETRPDWHRKQFPERDFCYFIGTDGF